MGLGLTPAMLQYTDEGSCWVIVGKALTAQPTAGGLMCFHWVIPVPHFLNQVKEFDSISRLDQWLTTMLLRIKKSIQGDGEGDGDLK